MHDLLPMIYYDCDVCSAANDRRGKERTLPSDWTETPERLVSAALEGTDEQGMTEITCSGHYFENLVAALRAAEQRGREEGSREMRERAAALADATEEDQGDKAVSFDPPQCIGHAGAALALHGIAQRIRALPLTPPKESNDA